MPAAGTKVNQTGSFKTPFVAATGYKRVLKPALENRRESCPILLGYNGGCRFFVGQARRSGDVRMLHALGFQVFSETGSKLG